MTGLGSTGSGESHPAGPGAADPVTADPVTADPVTADPVAAVVEARGVLCPVPVIRLAGVAARLPAGSLVLLLSDDPAAAYDVPAWCRLRGHELVSTEPDDPAWPRAAEPIETGPEPHVPNPHSGPALRHLIRLGSPAR